MSVSGPIFLTGMMASGKSSVARLLAEALDAPFIDLDARVERMFGSSIPALFARGEEHFRRLERLALESLALEPAFAARPSVVATGGGVVLDPRNRELMATVGTIICLDVEPVELARRLSTDEGVSLRPLVAAHAGDLLDRMKNLWHVRQEAYRDRSLSIDADAPLSVVVERILDALPKAVGMVGVGTSETGSGSSS